MGPAGTLATGVSITSQRCLNYQMKGHKTGAIFSMWKKSH